LKTTLQSKWYAAVIERRRRARTGRARRRRCQPFNVFAGVKY